MTLQEFIKQECDRIIEQVCCANLVSRSQLLSAAKGIAVVRARRVAIRLLKDQGFSPPQIAKAVGRSRSTIYYWSGARLRDRQRKNMREYQLRKKQEAELRA